MRSILILIATATLSLTRMAAQMPVPEILTVSEIQLFEADVAQNPADFAKAKVLGQNYAFQILGVTALSKYGLVTRRDPQVSSSAFAAHCRQVLETSSNAVVVGEGATTLWNARMGGVGAMLPRDQQRADGMFAAQMLNRAIAMNGTEPRWRSLRISMTIQESNFNRLPADQAYLLVQTDFDALSGEARYFELAKVSELAYKAGHLDDAATLASELLADSKTARNGFNKGNAIHAGNMVLGQIALRHGDIAGAQAFLVAAGATGGSPQLNSFGPNMSLALDLLKAGESKTVLQYFEECRSFWASGGAKLDEWAEDVSSGKTPQFGANLYY